MVRANGLRDKELEFLDRELFGVNYWVKRLLRIILSDEIGSDFVIRRCGK
jgi:hypothetical protein